MGRDGHDPSSTLIDDLVREVSHTAARSVHLLGGHLANEVSVALLLVSMCEAIAHEHDAPLEARLHALFTLSEVVHDPGAVNGELREALEHAGVTDEHAHLLEGGTPVLGALDALDPPAADLIASHLARVCLGLAEQLATQRPPESMDEARAAWYALVGVAGELVTDLLVNACEGLGAVAQDLRELAPAFAEGLLLSRLVRGGADEVERWRLPGEGRPPWLARVMGEDLALAAEYVGTLERGGGTRAMVAFAAFHAVVAIGLGTPADPPAHDPLEAVHRMIAEPGALAPRVARALADAGLGG